MRPVTLLAVAMAALLAACSGGDDDAAAGRPTATNAPQEHGLERRARVELVRV